jgi:three-Cys-motif partner protein
MPVVLDELDHGLPLADVGIWAPEEKHSRLRRYIDISKRARRKFLGRHKAGATYVDLFCGPGRARVRETGQIIDGSAVLAFKVATEGEAPFSKIYIADVKSSYVEACKRRLEHAGAFAASYMGEARTTVSEIAKQLNDRALHFAFLDPYNLAALPFEVIKQLATFRRMDMLIHVSAMDLQMNLRYYIEATESPLDTFAPGWRDVIDESQPDFRIRQQIREHWLGLIRTLDMQPSQGIELVTAGKNQPLYWLVLVSRHDKAHEFWEKIREVGPQRRLPLQQREYKS